jgi:hypothetical protein
MPLYWICSIALTVTVIANYRIWNMCRDVIITYYVESNATFACSKTTESLGLISYPLTEVEFVTSQIRSEAEITTPWHVKIHWPLVLKVITFKIVECRPWCIIPLANCAVQQSSDAHAGWSCFFLDRRVLMAWNKRLLFSRKYCRFSNRVSDVWYHSAGERHNLLPPGLSTKDIIKTLGGMVV